MTGVEVGKWGKGWGRGSEVRIERAACDPEKKNKDRKTNRAGETVQPPVTLCAGDQVSQQNVQQEAPKRLNRARTHIDTHLTPDTPGTRACLHPDTADVTC